MMRDDSFFPHLAEFAFSGRQRHLSSYWGKPRKNFALCLDLHQNQQKKTLVRERHEQHWICSGTEGSSSRTHKKQLSFPRVSIAFLLSKPYSWNVVAFVIHDAILVIAVVVAETPGHLSLLEVTLGKATLNRGWTESPANCWFFSEQNTWEAIQSNYGAGWRLLQVFTVPPKLHFENCFFGQFVLELLGIQNLGAKSTSWTNSV